MKKFLVPLSALLAMTVPVAAHAAQCRDAKGHFINCAHPNARPATATAAHPAAPHAAAAAKPAAAKPAAAKPAAAPARPAAVAAKPAAAKPATQRCRIGNRFAKCGTPGAHPM